MCPIPVTITSFKLSSTLTQIFHLEESVRNKRSKGVFYKDPLCPLLSAHVGQYVGEYRPKVGQ